MEGDISGAGCLQCWAGGGGGGGGEGGREGGGEGQG